MLRVSSRENERLLLYQRVTGMLTIVVEILVRYSVRGTVVVVVVDAMVVRPFSKSLLSNET